MSINRIQTQTSPSTDTHSSTTKAGLFSSQSITPLEQHRHKQSNAEEARALRSPCSTGSVDLSKLDTSPAKPDTKLVKEFIEKLAQQYNCSSNTILDIALRSLTEYFPKKFDESTIKPLQTVLTILKESNCFTEDKAKHPPTTKQIKNIRTELHGLLARPKTSYSSLNLTVTQKPIGKLTELPAPKDDTKPSSPCFPSRPKNSSAQTCSPTAGATRIKKKDHIGNQAANVYSTSISTKSAAPCKQVLTRSARPDTPYKLQHLLQSSAISAYEQLISGDSTEQTGLRFDEKTNSYEYDSMVITAMDQNPVKAYGLSLLRHGGNPAKVARNAANTFLHRPKHALMSGENERKNIRELQKSIDTLFTNKDTKRPKTHINVQLTISKPNGETENITIKIKRPLFSNITISSQANKASNIQKHRDSNKNAALQTCHLLSQRWYPESTSSTPQATSLTQALSILDTITENSSQPKTLAKAIDRLKQDGGINVLKSTLPLQKQMALEWIVLTITGQSLFNTDNPTLVKPSDPGKEFLCMTAALTEANYTPLVSCKSGLDRTLAKSALVLAYHTLMDSEAEADIESWVFNNTATPKLQTIFTQHFHELGNPVAGFERETVSAPGFVDGPKIKAGIGSKNAHPVTQELFDPRYRHTDPDNKQYVCPGKAKSSKIKKLSLAQKVKNHLILRTTESKPRDISHYLSEYQQQMQSNINGTPNWPEKQHKLNKYADQLLSGSQEYLPDPARPKNSSFKP